MSDGRATVMPSSRCSAPAVLADAAPANDTRNSINDFMTHSQFQSRAGMAHRAGDLAYGAFAGRCVFRYSATTATNSSSETVPLPSLSVLPKPAFIASGTSPIVRAASPLASSR